MNKFRIETMLFVLLAWLATSAFRPGPPVALVAMPGSAASVAAAPADFGKVSPTNGQMNASSTILFLNWNASSANVTYEYCLRTNRASCPSPKWTNAGSATSVPVQNLSPNVTYYWQVRAIDNATQAITEADYGAWWQFTTKASQILPGPFSKLSPADGSTSTAVSGLTLTWGATSNVISYEYCYDTANNNQCDQPWVNVGNTTSVTLPNLAFDTLYYWQVRAVNAGGKVEADYNTWWSFRTQTTPPGAFRKLLPANAATGQPLSLTLSWESSPGSGITYEYCFDSSLGNTCKNAASWTGVGANLSANLSGLSYGTTYFWQVRAVNTTGTTYADGGAYWGFSTLIAPPAGFEKTAPADNLIDVPLNPTLTWAASSGTGVSYEYCYSTTSTNNACDGVWYLAGTSTSASLSGLSYNTLYYWQVRAVNTSGTTYANGSTLWHFTTQVAPPWPFDKISPSTGTGGAAPNLHLEWSSSTGAAEYFYCVDESNNDACDSGWVLNNANTTAAPAGLVTGRTYYWQVYARNGEGNTLADDGTWWSFSTKDIIPNTFAKINPTGNATNQSLTPWLYWTPSEGATSYQYCISTSAACPAGGWKTVGPEPTATYLHLGSTEALQNNTEYFWQISAVAGGNTVYADGPDWWSFTTLMAPPTSSSQSFSVNEDTLLSKTLTFNSGYTPNFTLVGSRPTGTLSLASDGTLTYFPPLNFNGQVTFQFVLSDGYNLPAGPYTVTITVEPVDDAPVLQPIPDQTVKTNGLAAFTVSASDADIPYGDALTYAIVEALPEGANFDAKTGVFTWVTKWTYLHPEPYTFTVSVTDKDHPLVPVQQVIRITVLPEITLFPIVRK